MVKRRHKTFHRDTKKDKAIEAFADQADQVAPLNDSKTPHDPQAKRDFKSINIPMNAYEYEVLDSLSNALGRTKSNTLRWAFLKLFEETKAD